MRHQLQQDHSTLEDDKESRMAEEASNMAPGDICAGNSMVLEPIEACVHSLIKRIAWERPSAPAICSWDGDLTYQQLDQASSKLAHQLVHVGVKLQTKVVLCFERT
jgi:non-ribosomal peptide synthetase component F